MYNILCTIRILGHFTQNTEAHSGISRFIIRTIEVWHYLSNVSTYLVCADVFYCSRNYRNDLHPFSYYFSWKLKRCPELGTFDVIIVIIWRKWGFEDILHKNSGTIYIMSNYTPSRFQKMPLKRRSDFWSSLSKDWIPNCDPFCANLVLLLPKNDTLGLFSMCIA